MIENLEVNRKKKDLEWIFEKNKMCTLKIKKKLKKVTKKSKKCKDKSDVFI